MKRVSLHRIVPVLSAVSRSHGVGGWDSGFDKLSHLCERNIGIARFEQRCCVPH